MLRSREISKLDRQMGWSGRRGTLRGFIYGHEDGRAGNEHGLRSRGRCGPGDLELVSNRPGAGRAIVLDQGIAQALPRHEAATLGKLIPDLGCSRVRGGLRGWPRVTKAPNTRHGARPQVVTSSPWVVSGRCQMRSDPLLLLAALVALAMGHIYTTRCAMLDSSHRQARLWGTVGKMLFKSTPASNATGTQSRRRPGWR